jgi:flagellar motility protein MotE (MotC chaperone)
MIRLLRDFRLLPLVLIAAVALLSLKSLGLVFDGGYILNTPETEEAGAAAVDPDDIVGSVGAAAKPPPVVTVIAAPASPPSRQSWAQEMFNFPDVTGSVSAPKKDAPAAKPAPGRKAAKDPTERPQTILDQRGVSPAERAILERLQERRKELEAKAKDLEMREQLLKAAEKRLEARLNELKQTESRIKLATDKKDEAESARFKGLVAMYENMKAKDAARIFDRLDLKILTEVAGQINPRRMSDILANMSSEAAERLTVEFASRGGPKTTDPADLPKIEGRPNPNPAPPANPSPNP